MEIAKNSFTFMFLQRGSTISHLYRQPWSRSQNPSSRRGNRVPTSSRMVQLRNRFHRQFAAVSTSARNLEFPVDMDIEMVSFFTPVFCSFLFSFFFKPLLVNFYVICARHVMYIPF